MILSDDCYSTLGPGPAVTELWSRTCGHGSLESRHLSPLRLYTGVPVRDLSHGSDITALRRIRRPHAQGSPGPPAGPAPAGEFLRHQRVGHVLGPPARWRFGPLSLPSPAARRMLCPFLPWNCQPRAASRCLRSLASSERRCKRYRGQQ